MSVQTDLDGYPRVSSGGVDMGAFEVPCPTGSILYVDHDATGSEDGSSWANACVELSDAIRAAHCGGVNEIWVAAGTYRPTKNGDREATFSLVNGVSIYGGFAGGEVSLDQRSLLPDSTVLSGDIGTPGDSADNSFHVIDGSGTNATAVLDGFAVTAGAATGSPPNDSGGGMIVVAGSPTLRHLHFIGNQATDGGGAIYNSAASPALTDVRFTGNSANSGGAVYNFNGSAPRFVNAVFITNAAMVHGGALSSDASSPAVFNSQFIGNTAPTGGAVYGVGAAVATFVNTTFWSNAASDQGGAIFSRSSCNPVVTNDILWDNSAGNSGPELGNDTATPTISHCIVKGSNGSGASWDVALGSDGGGNQDANPMFINPVAGDFHVTQGSPAIDAGLNSAVPSDVVTDFDGHARILNGIVDLGPYEYFVQFTDVTAAAGLGGSSGLATGWGMAWGDYDNDGDMDLFYPGGGLYRNNGDGTFTNVGAPLAGQYALGAAWGDYDGDNDPDLYVGWPAGSILYRNDGGSFADVTASAGINVSGGWGGAWGDYDNDGDLDLYAVADTLTHLYRNQGDGTFIDEGSTSGIAAFPNSVGGVWGDFDLDGYLDLYVVAFDTGGRLYRNNGDGTFSDVTASVGISTCATGFSANWVDYDRDRDPDLHVASGCGATGRLFKNNLSSLFSDVTGSAGITAGTFAGWSDFDNDGDFDVGVGDWMVADAFRLFRNNGSGTFTDVTTTAHATGSGAQLGWADYDNDGDFDLYVLGGVGAAPGPNRLLRNNQVYSSGHHWLHVRLVGVWSNRSGIGARVRCVVGKNAETCEISGGNGLSQNSLIAAFGLGSATVADTLEVFWPRGAHQVLTHQLGDREITVTELAPTGVATDDHLPKEYALYENFPNPFNPTTTIRFDLPAPGKVQLDIFDVTGRLVKRLIRDVPYSRGRFEVHWNGENESGNTVASGVYFYRIRSGTYSAARRMVLLK
ncbi:MAG TPA: FG-GAP-like repeat-containing protein [Candidatus Krumholzibacteria bacterium]|nr:FG-GAP-like repeat-containing protein [Candidatus Krumholzibacteria bacterium]